METSTFLLGICAVLGLAATASQTRPANAASLLDAGLWVLAGALLGGRAVFVGLTWTYYQAHLLKIPQVWLGGFSAPGALCGGILAVLLVTLFTKRTAGELLEALEPLAATVGVGAWLAAWLDDAAYGIPFAGAIALPAADEWGRVAARWPVQLVGALITLGGYTALDLARRLKSGTKPLHWRGAAGGIGLLFQGLLLFGLGFFRGDPALTWNGMRLDAWGGLAGAAAALIALLILRREWGQNNNEAEPGTLADKHPAG